MRLLSTLLSLCLHLSVVLLAVFWPTSSPKVRLDMPVQQVRLVSIAGKPAAGKSAPAVKPAAPKPAPAPAPKPEPAPAPPPPPAPAPVAAPKPEPVPVPKPDATPISPKKEAVVPEPPKPRDEKEPEKKPEPKPEPKPDTKTDPKKEAKPEPKKQEPKKPPQPSPEDILKAALADTSKEVKKSAQSKEQSGQQTLSQELAALQAAVEASPGMGDALEGIGEEGIEGPPTEGVIGSIEDLYAIAVQNLVKKNWRFPQMATRDELVTRVRIVLSPDGAILDASVVTSSGRPDFDGSALRAVSDTKQLPKPPTPDISSIVINFNSHE